METVIKYDVWIYKNNPCLIQAVADPEYPIPDEGATPQCEGASLGQNVPKNCMKIKEIEPRGGDEGGVGPIPDAPIGSAIVKGL